MPNMEATDGGKLGRRRREKRRSCESRKRTKREGETKAAQQALTERREIRHVNPELARDRSLVRVSRQGKLMEDRKMHRSGFDRSCLVWVYTER